ncbi:MAG: DNA-binding SARP family transcriptional activator [Granulosicoccus sp.]
MKRFVCPAGKTAPVHLDRTITRGRFLLISTTPPPVTIISASAGCGKSVLGGDIFKAHVGKKLWFSLDEDDNDIELLLCRLTAAISRELELDIKNLMESQLQAEPFASTLDVLVETLTSTSTPTLVVFDNVDLLAAGLSLNCIVRLQGLLGPSDSLIYLTRDDPRALQRKVATHSITETELLFSDGDCQALIEAKYPSLQGYDNREINRLCVGWPILAQRVLEQLSREDDIRSDAVEHNTQLHLLRILKKHLSDEDIRALQLLAFSPSVPVPLIQNCVGSKFVTRLPNLSKMMGSLLSFDSHSGLEIAKPLQMVLEDNFDKLQRHRVRLALNLHIDHALENENWEQMLYLLTKSKELDRLEDFLKSNSTTLIISGNYSDLSIALRSILNLTFAQHPFIALFIGRVFTEISPIKAQPYLETALSSFKARGDAVGELLTMIHRRALQMNFAAAMQLHEENPRLLELMAIHGEHLPAYEQIILNLQLSAHYVFTEGDSDLANNQLDATAALIAKGNWINSAVRCDCYRLTNHVFHQRGTAAQDLVEKLGRYDLNQLTESTRILVSTVQANWLSFTGDIIALEAHLNDFLASVDREMFEQSQACGLIYLWLADFSLLSGDYQKSIGILEQARNLLAFMVEGDWKNHGHWFMALAQAARGDHTSAKQELANVSRFSTTRTYAIRQRLVMASTFLLLEDYSSVRKLLSEVDIEQKTYPHFGTVAAAVRYWLHRAEGDEAAARTQLDRWLSGITGSSNPRFFAVGYTRDLIIKTFTAASLLHSDNAAFTRRMQLIAGQYLQAAVTKDFEIVPRMQVVTGPVFGIQVDEVEISLTKVQRRIMTELIFAKEQRLSVHALQESVWPDDHNENRFHTTMSRLRKSLSASGAKPSTYIDQRGGYIKLQHLDVDLFRFTQERRRYQQSIRQGKLWTARGAGFAALEQWTGTFDPDISLRDNLAGDLHQHLMAHRQLCVQLATESINLGAGANNLIEVVAGLYASDEADIDLAKSLIHLYRLRGEGTSAHKIRQRYHSAISAENFSSEEVAQLLQELG